MTVQCFPARLKPQGRRNYSALQPRSTTRSGRRLSAARQREHCCGSIGHRGGMPKHYPTAEGLLSELDAFGLGKDVVGAAASALSNPESRKRLVKFAEEFKYLLRRWSAQIFVFLID